MEKKQNNIYPEYSANGDGKAIIEILNIGFEPLLTQKEYKIYQEIGSLKETTSVLKHSIAFLEAKLSYLDDTECYFDWLKRRLQKQSSKKYFTKKSKNTKKAYLRKCWPKTSIKQESFIITGHLKKKNNSGISLYLKAN